MLIYININNYYIYYYYTYYQSISVYLNNTPDLTQLLFLYNVTTESNVICIRILLFPPILHHQSLQLSQHVYRSLFINGHTTDTLLFSSSIEPPLSGSPIVFTCYLGFKVNLLLRAAMILRCYPFTRCISSL